MSQMRRLQPHLPQLHCSTVVFGTSHHLSGDDAGAGGFGALVNQNVGSLHPVAPLVSTQPDLTVVGMLLALKTTCTRILCSLPGLASVAIALHAMAHSAT